MEEKKLTVEEPTVRFGDQHWGQYKLISFKISGRNPKNLKEWLVAFWNWDIFWGEVPIIKVIALISWLIALVV